MLTHVACHRSVSPARRARPIRVRASPPAHNPHQQHDGRTQQVSERRIGQRCARNWPRTASCSSCLAVAAVLLLPRTLLAASSLERATRKLDIKHSGYALCKWLFATKQVLCSSCTPDTISTSSIHDCRPHTAVPYLCSPLRQTCCCKALQSCSRRDLQHISNIFTTYTRSRSLQQVTPSPPATDIFAYCLLGCDIELVVCSLHYLLIDQNTCVVCCHTGVIGWLTFSSHRVAGQGKSKIIQTAYQTTPVLLSCVIVLLSCVIHGRVSKYCSHMSLLAQHSRIDCWPSMCALILHRSHNTDKVSVAPFSRMQPTAAAKLPAFIVRIVPMSGASAGCSCYTAAVAMFWQYQQHSCVS